MCVLLLIQNGYASNSYCVSTQYSVAFDREQESEADASGVHYLAKADINPQASADFFFRLSHEKENISLQFELLNTHPNSTDRAAEIIKLRKRETFTIKKTSEKSHINVIPRSGATRNLVFHSLRAVGKNKNEIHRAVYPAESGTQNDKRQLPFYGIPYSGTIFQMSLKMKSN